MNTESKNGKSHKSRSLPRLRAKLAHWKAGAVKDRLSPAEKRPQFMVYSGGQDKETKAQFTSGSGEFIIDRVYTPLDVAETDYIQDIGFPGEYPYTRGRDPLGYRAFRWPLGFYAGYGSGESANQRYRELYAAGSREIGLALDLPTQLGMDSDDPLAEGEVGKVGLALDTVTDLERAYDGIPLANLHSGTVGNCIGPWMLAMFCILCERASLQPSQLGILLQNDPFKEYTGRGTFIFPPTVATDLASDVVEYICKHIPRWEPQWSCTTTLRWGGCSASQEIGFGIANLMCYVEAARQKGVKPQDFVPRINLHMTSDSDLLEEVAKLRAVRRLWARLARERLGTKDPTVLALRVTTYTAANRLTAQEPLNNIIRSTIHVLASMLAGIDHITVAAYDEALALPTFESTRLASLTKQILNDECYIGNTVDPLGGSYYVESLTNQIEEKGKYWYDQVEAMGGANAAIERGYYLKKMAEGQFQYQKEVESGERQVIGVNKYVLDKKISVNLFKGNPDDERKQIERLNSVKRHRDSTAVSKSLAELRRVAESKAAGTTINIMPAMLQAVRVSATEGEIFLTLRDVFGDYRPPIVF